MGKVVHVHQVRVSRGVHESSRGDFLTQPTMVGQKKCNLTQPII